MFQPSAGPKGLGDTPGDAQGMPSPSSWGHQNKKLSLNSTNCLLGIVSRNHGKSNVVRIRIAPRRFASTFRRRPFLRNRFPCLQPLKITPMNTALTYKVVLVDLVSKCLGDVDKNFKELRVDSIIRGSTIFGGDYYI